MNSTNNYMAFDTFLGSGKRNRTADINDFLFVGTGYTRNELSEQDVTMYDALITSEL
jgi:hypothetical protein